MCLAALCQATTLTRAGTRYNKSARGLVPARERVVLAREVVTQSALPPYHRFMRHLMLACLLASSVLLPGCQSAMMAIKEKAGIPKRDQLVARVTDVQEAQQEAKNEFQSALDQFLAMSGGTGTQLEKTYKKLQGEYQDAESAVSNVKKRIDNTETVSSALFREWQTEIGTYTNANLKAQSQQQYTTTKAQYDQLLGTMKTAAAKMDPVLNTFREHVLFLKHNLNAQAIGSLMNSERAAIESEVGTLVADMQRSIDEADAFMQK